MHHPAKILIARLSSIGDIILTTPVIRGVRMKFPDASITFLVKAKFAPLLMHNPHIDEVLVYNDSAGKGELQRLVKKIRKQEFDWFIDLHKSLRTRYIRTLLGFPEVTTYNKQIFSRTLLVKFGINRFKTIKPVYLRYFEAVEKNGITYDRQGTEVDYSQNDSQLVENLLDSDGYKSLQQLIVICPGASYKNKQWLPERFAEIADELTTPSGRFLAFLGGKADTELCDGIIAMMKNKAVNYAGRLSLLQSAALLHKSALVITNDSGMMHLAQAQKSPVVAIFGATCRELGFFPLPENSITVEKKVSCRPCTHKGLNRCPRKHFNCMNLITADDVMAAAQKFLPE
ncbi:MAG TPA: glycosyltransferase family 9 protein [Bacteroidales bacterium]|nr:glycosyltransferase family 9 protein [Bacteroidales bacterium]